MSFEVIKMVFEHSKSRGSAQHVLLALADAVNEKNRQLRGEVQCFPSVNYLAKRTGLSYRCVRDQIDKLVALGEISKRNRGYHRSNVYTILIPFDETDGSDLE